MRLQGNGGIKLNNASGASGQCLVSKGTNVQTAWEYPKPQLASGGGLEYDGNGKLTVTAGDSSCTKFGNLWANRIILRQSGTANYPVFAWSTATNTNWVGIGGTTTARRFKSSTHNVWNANSGDCGGSAPGGNQMLFTFELGNIPAGYNPTSSSNPAKSVNRKVEFPSANNGSSFSQTCKVAGPANPVRDSNGNYNFRNEFVTVSTTRAANSIDVNTATDPEVSTFDAETLLDTVLGTDNVAQPATVLGNLIKWRTFDTSVEPLMVGDMNRPQLQIDVDALEAIHPLLVEKEYTDDSFDYTTDPETGDYVSKALKPDPADHSTYNVCVNHNILNFMTMARARRNKTRIVNLSAALGVGTDSDLGTFTGTTITENATVKEALQDLETAFEAAGLGATPPVLIEVQNASGSDIAKGSPVYVSGTDATGIPEVELADANGANTYPVIGLTSEIIANGTAGYVVISGKISGIDTDSAGYTAGDSLYLSETAGELTSTRPTAAGSQVQKVAIVVRRDATAGSIVVMGAGRTNDVPNELTALTGVGLDDADLGAFSGSTITDNVSIKTALQELETEVETKIAAETITMADFKAVVAASSSFSDFQTNVAAL